MMAIALLQQQHIMHCCGCGSSSCMHASVHTKSPQPLPELAVELQQQLLHVSYATRCTDECHQLALWDASQLTTAAAAAAAASWQRNT
jgi:hypothetical protein